MIEIIALSFAVGWLYGSRIPGEGARLTIFSGLALALLLGNYPYYQPAGLATTYFSALTGIVFGGWARK